MRKIFELFACLLQLVVNILDRRVPISQLAKTEDLVLSNASLNDLKTGINKIYTQVNTFEKRN
ncbi:hypothetical protein [Viridibacillus arvi]|uniref:hypothetical protein n=1 Tax=Viridibacillus arvi TaxID=263475 RepID=UPI0034CF6F7C